MIYNILVQGFCPLKISQFPDGFRLNLYILNVFFLFVCFHFLLGPPVLFYKNILSATLNNGNFVLRACAMDCIS